jgi:xanthine dehydrogenase accessory factor
MATAEHGHEPEHGHDQHGHLHEHEHEHEHDPSCAVAHGHAQLPADEGGQKVLAAVFASPVASYLLRYGADAGYRTVLIEPDPDRAKAALTAEGDAGEVADSLTEIVTGNTDVVVTDHHRPELGVQLRDALAANARWVGIMGNPRHEAPHVAAMTELGVPAVEIRKVHRPIGINIGSKTPAEIAIATMAGLIADRNGKPGGFEF